MSRDWDEMRKLAILIAQEEATELGYCDEDIAALAEPDGDDLLTVQAVERALERQRALVANLYVAAGCNCCRDEKAWQAASDQLGQLLGVPRYEDDSGVDWYAARDDAERGKR